MDWELEEISAGIEEIKQRLDRIEGRQRANEHHDPGCAFLMAAKRQRHTGAYIEVPPCNCWLSEEA